MPTTTTPPPTSMITTVNAQRIYNATLLLLLLLLLLILLVQSNFPDKSDAIALITSLKKNMAIYCDFASTGWATRRKRTLLEKRALGKGGILADLQFLGS